MRHTQNPKVDSEPTLGNHDGTIGILDVRSNPTLCNVVVYGHITIFVNLRLSIVSN